MRLALVYLSFFVLVACAQDGSVPRDAPVAATRGCLAAGDGKFEAAIRGAFDADIRWTDAQMECDGGLRPDGQGMRVTVLGPLAGAQPDSAPRQLRFIIGMDLRDAAAGPAQVLPTNLTVIIEGESQLYSTMGDDKCAVEGLQREPLSAGLEKVSGRGYCLGQASDLSGEKRLLVDTFSFTSLVRIDADIATPAP